MPRHRAGALKFHLAFPALPHTASKACARSEIRSSIFSMPTEMRISASVRPISSRSSGATPEWVIASGVRDQRLGAAEADRELHDLEIVEERESLPLAALDVEGEGRARCRALPVEDRLARVALLQVAEIVQPGDLRMSRQGTRRLAGRSRWRGSCGCRASRASASASSMSSGRVACQVNRANP